MSSLFKPSANLVIRSVLVLLGVGAAGAIGSLMLFERVPANTHQQEEVEQPLQFDHRHHVGEEGIDCRYCHSSVETSAYAGIPPTATCMNCHAQIWNKSPLLDKVRNAYFSDRSIPWVKVHKLPDYVYFNHSIHVAKGVGCVTCHGAVDGMPSVTQVAPLSMSWCLDCHRQPEKYVRPKEHIYDLDWGAYTNVTAANWMPDGLMGGARTSQPVGDEVVAARASGLAALATTTSATESANGGSSDGVSPELGTEAHHASVPEPGSAEYAREIGSKLVVQYDVHPRTSCDTCHR